MPTTGATTKMAVCYKLSTMTTDNGTGRSTTAVLYCSALTKRSHNPFSACQPPVRSQCVPLDSAPDSLLQSTRKMRAHTRRHGGCGLVNFQILPTNQVIIDDKKGIANWSAIWWIVIEAHIWLQQIECVCVCSGELAWTYQLLPARILAAEDYDHDYVEFLLTSYQATGLNSAHLATHSQKSAIFNQPIFGWLLSSLYFTK